MPRAAPSVLFHRLARAARFWSAGRLSTDTFDRIVQRIRADIKAHN